MADALDDFFASGTTSAPAKPPASLDDFFATGDSGIDDSASPTRKEGYVEQVDKQGRVQYVRPVGAEAFNKAGGGFHPGAGLAGAADISLAAAHAVPMGAIGGIADIAQRATGDQSGSWRDTVGRFTYQPQTEGGKELFRGLGQTLPAQAVRQGLAALPPETEPLTRVAGDVLRVAPVMGMFGRFGKSVGGGESAAEPPAPAAPENPAGLQAQLAPQYAGQSMGSAGATPNLLNATPELRAKVQEVVSSGQPLSDAGKIALQRHVEAESLPVPAKLTRGQALGDEAIKSDEFNSKGKQPQIGQRFEEQNQNLIDNLDALRNQAGPEVFSTDMPAHGDTLINAYKTKDAAVKADITAKYQALQDANGGEFPVDGQAFATNAKAALKKDMKAPFLPSGVARLVDDYGDGEPMTFENFENLRTTLAAEARSAERAGNGNAARAVSVVRESLESLPMAEGSVKMKMLADQARQAAKARFDALDADPAYKAAVNDTVAPDDFVRKYVIGGKRDKVSLMRQNLAHDDVAQQTMSVAALDHLKEQSGAVKGKFSQEGYNKALRGLSPKIGSLVDPNVAEQLDRLGEVAKWEMQQGRGGYYNNSGTWVAAAKEHAAGMAEAGANAVGHGVPLGSMVRNAIRFRGKAKDLKATLEPGAGIAD